MPQQFEKKISEEEYKKIEEYYAVGLGTSGAIARFLRISETTYDRMLKHDERLQHIRDTARDTTSLNYRKTVVYEATKQSREVEREIITVTVDKKGKEISKTKEVKTIRKKISPSAKALDLWGTTQEGFIKTDRYEHTGKDGAPIVIRTVEEIDAEIAELSKALKK